MAEQPPSPETEDQTGRRCEICSRVFVTILGLARAIHSGCALTGERHSLDDCPSRNTFMLDAKVIHGNIERQADEQN